MKIELSENYTFDEYRELFHRILDEKKMNKTSERFNILREIYKIEGHFNVEMLYNNLKSKKYQVSKTTIYNTLDILVTFNLIEKHHFGDNYAHYEKHNVQKSHDHIVMIDTGEIIEFQSEEIEKIIKEIEKNYNVTIFSRSFTLFCHKKN